MPALKIGRHKSCANDRQKNGITRQINDQIYSCATTEALSDSLDVSPDAGGTFSVSAGITTLTFFATCDTLPDQFTVGPTQAVDNRTYLPLYDAAGVAVTMAVVPGRVYVFPAAVGLCSAIKIVANAVGTIAVAFKS
jgi:acetyl esterase/lipase